MYRHIHTRRHNIQPTNVHMHAYKSQRNHRVQCKSRQSFAADRNLSIHNSWGSLRKNRGSSPKEESMLAFLFSSQDPRLLEIFFKSTIWQSFLLQPCGLQKERKTEVNGRTSLRGKNCINKRRNRQKKCIQLSQRRRVLKIYAYTYSLNISF